MRCECSICRFLRAHPGLTAFMRRLITPRRSALLNRAFKAHVAFTLWWMLFCTVLVVLRTNGMAGSWLEDAAECCLWLGFAPYALLLRHAWVHYRRGEAPGACGDPTCGVGE